MPISHRQCRVGGLLLTLVGIFTASSAYAQITVTRIQGSTPSSSRAFAVSADGSVVVGDAGFAGLTTAFRWTEATGTVNLGVVPADSFFGTANASVAESVSADGSVIVGRSLSVSTGNLQAFRWTAATGMVGLGALSGGGPDSAAIALSADGSVIVGRSSSANTIFTLTREAFRWTSSTGMVGLGDLSGGSFNSFANGISADGSVIVGAGNSADGVEATRWTQATGMVSIGDLPGGSVNTVAQDVSADGSVIVGNGTSASGVEAFRWTLSDGMVGLGDLAGGSFSSIAYGVSADGGVIAGRGTTTAGNRAFVWTSAQGMVDLNTYILALGGSLGTFTSLTEAFGISADGTTIVGQGLVGETIQAFRVHDPNRFGLGPVASATAPEPATCSLLILGILAGASTLRRRQR